MAIMTDGKKQLAIASLMLNPSIKDASLASGVPERTLYRWVKTDEFQEALRVREKAQLDESARLLLSITKRAIILLGQMINNAVTDGARIRAAQIIIETSMRFRELITLEERITKLEQR